MMFKVSHLEGPRERSKRLAEWHSCFAWYPVRMFDSYEVASTTDEICWLETVERRGWDTGHSSAIGTSNYWIWHYRKV